MGIRQRTIEAVRELSLERGLSGWTVDELSQRAGISKRTLYRYFTSKEELLNTVLDEFLHGIAEEVDQLLASQNSPEQIFSKMLNSLIIRSRFLTGPQSLEDLRRSYPQLWEKIDHFRMEKIYMLLEYAVRHYPDTILASIDLRIFSTGVMAAIQAVVNPVFLLENGFTFEEALMHLSRLIMSAFQPALLLENKPQ